MMLALHVTVAAQAPTPTPLNPLKGLPELPKYHHTWNDVPTYLTPDALDGLLLDHARITGSLAPHLSLLSNQTVMDAVVSVARKATGLRKDGKPVGIHIIRDGCLKGATSQGIGPGTACSGQCETDAVNAFTAPLQQAKTSIDAANAKLGGSPTPVLAVSFDCEGIWWDASIDSPNHAGIQRHNELMFNSTRAIFARPVQILNYMYGNAEFYPTGTANPAVTGDECDKVWAQFALTSGKPDAKRSDVLPPGWCARPAPVVYSERFDADAPFVPSLYEVNRDMYTQQRFKWTSELAMFHNVPNGSTVPFLALGMAWNLTGQILPRNGARPPTLHAQPTHNALGSGPSYTLDPHPVGTPFSELYKYDHSFSKFIGQQINLKRFEHSNYGPWERCTAVVFFLGAYSPQPGEGPNPSDWNSMQHFAAYVKGAADM